MMNPAFADVRADVEPLLIAVPTKETDVDAVVDDADENGPVADDEPSSR